MRWSSFGLADLGSARSRCAHDSARAAGGGGLSTRSRRVRVVLGPRVASAREREPRMGRAGTDAVRAVLPNSRVVGLEGEGHFAILTAPELVRRRSLGSCASKPSAPPAEG